MLIKLKAVESKGGHQGYSWALMAMDPIRGPLVSIKDWSLLLASYLFKLPDPIEAEVKGRPTYLSITARAQVLTIAFQTLSFGLLSKLGTQ